MSNHQHAATDLLTVPRAAAAVGLSTTTIRRAIRAQRLEHVRLGDTDRSPIGISPTALRAWLAAHTRPADADTEPRRIPKTSGRTNVTTGRKSLAARARRRHREHT